MEEFVKGYSQVILKLSIFDKLSLLLTKMNNEKARPSHWL